MFKRGYRSFLLYIALFMMIPIQAFAADVPQEVQKYADEHYLDVVQQLVFEKGPPADFGFQSEPGEISIGSLFSVYTVTPEFIKGEVKEEGIVPAKEWIAPIFQNGTPVNIIGFYERPNGEIYLAGLNYVSPELPSVLATLKGNEKLIRETPKDAWYVYANDQIHVLNKKTSAKSTLTVSNFQSYMQDQYLDDLKQTEDDLVGGINSEIEVTSYANNSIQSYLWWALVFLITATMVVYNIHSFFCKSQMSASGLVSDVPVSLAGTYFPYEI